MTGNDALVDRLNRAIDRLENWATGLTQTRDSDREELRKLYDQRQNDLADLNNLRQEVRNLIEEIKND